MIFLESLIEAEIEWIEYLIKHQLNICIPIPSKSAQKVHSLKIQVKLILHQSVWNTTKMFNITPEKAYQIMEDRIAKQTTLLEFDFDNLI